MTAHKASESIAPQWPNNLGVIYLKTDCKNEMKYYKCTGMLLRYINGVSFYYKLFLKHEIIYGKIVHTLIVLYLLTFFSPTTYNISRYIYELFDNYRNYDTMLLLEDSEG